MVNRDTGWAHQLAAVEYAHDKSSALLQCGMGTGKTWMALYLMQLWENRPRSSRTLIICPLAVAPVWMLEAEKHDFKHHMLDLSEGPVKKRAETLDRWLKTSRGPLVAIINYEAFWRESLWRVVGSVQWDTVILDEAHRIKAPFGVTSMATRKLTTTRKLALTGTPMPHSPMDVWSLFMWLDPTIFGWNFTAFRARYAVLRRIKKEIRLKGSGKLITKEISIVVGYRDLAELSEKMSSCTYHVERDVLNLPEAIHNVLPVHLGGATLKAYRQFEKFAYTQIENGVVSAGNALVKLLRLQQLTSGFIASDSEWVLDNGQMSWVKRLGTEKFDTLVSWLSDLEPDEKVVVFCRFSEDLLEVERACNTAEPPRKYYEQSGPTKRWREWSTAEGGAVLGAQLQAAGEGIDLTAARFCMYFSEPWSLGQHEQTLARVHRPGQTRTVYYYYLVASGTVDEDVRKSLEEKAEVVDIVMSGIRDRQGLDKPQLGA